MSEEFHVINQKNKRDPNTAAPSGNNRRNGNSSVESYLEKLLARYRKRKITRSFSYELRTT